MKYSKVAAVVAGTVIAVGTGSTAFAGTGASAAPAMPSSINGGVDELLAAQPLQKTMTGSHLDKVVGGVDKTTDAVQKQAASDQLLGQVTDAVRGSALQTLTGALPGASLLGGLPLGGLPLGG